MMASQKLTNGCVAAMALVTAAHLSTPHSSTIARLAFGAFCLAIHFLLSCESIKNDLRTKGRDTSSIMNIYFSWATRRSCSMIISPPWN
jgi:hypothetical protein